MGTTDDINRLVQRYKVDEVLTRLPSSDGRVVREIVGRIEGAKSGLKYRIMPGVLRAAERSGRDQPYP